MKPLVLAIIFAALVAGALPLAYQADADAHRGWMDDAADLQEDLRDAFRLKESAKAAEAAGKLEALMARTESYWAAKKADDIVKLAQEARAQAKDMGTAASAGKFDDAQKAFETLNATCNTCHDLHPEKR